MGDDKKTLLLDKKIALSGTPVGTLPRNSTGTAAPPGKTPPGKAPPGKAPRPDEDAIEKGGASVEVKGRLDELILGRTLPVFKKAHRTGQASARLSESARSVLKWAVSALTALVLFSLLVEYYYTFTPFRVDRLTGVETPSEGAVIYKFTEGSGRSVYSAHGIVAENPATTSLPSVLFLGSSFTQGLEVDDDEKFTSMFEKNWNESHVNGLHAVNAGLGHSNLLIQMNRAAGMKKVYDPVFTFIQISKWELIDKIIAPEFSSWVEIVDGRPVVHTRSPSPPGTDSFFKEILVGTHLYSGLHHIRNNLGAFMPGGAGSGDGVDHRAHYKVSDEKTTRTLIDWQIAELSELLPGRLAFIYFSTCPAIHDGLLEMEDPEGRRLAGMFGDACEKRGVGFIDMYGDFRDYYLESKQFVKGFFNTRPSFGHLNPAGHELVARRLVEYTQTVENDIFEH